MDEFIKKYNIIGFSLVVERALNAAKVNSLTKELEDCLHAGLIDLENALEDYLKQN